MNKDFFRTAIKGLMYIGQIGIDIVVPPLVLGYLAVRLCRRFNIGTWLVVLALIIGILTAAASTINFFRSILSKTAKDSEKISTISFRNHK